jgi:hypothetical protein
VFTRRSTGQGDETDRPRGEPGIGVGAQVFVLSRDEDATTPWPEGPTGVVVRAGGSAWQGVTGISGSRRSWTVEFSEPQRDRDGQGPYDSAQVPERFLRLAPVGDGS